MYLLRLLLPLHDNSGQAFPAAFFADVRTALLERFGGLTAHMQSTARGFWVDDAANVRRDEIIIFEIYTTELDKAWWAEYRTRLEERFRQDEIVIQAQQLELL